MGELSLRRMGTRQDYTLKKVGATSGTASNVSVAAKAVNTGKQIYPNFTPEDGKLYLGMMDAYGSTIVFIGYRYSDTAINGCIVNSNLSTISFNLNGLTLYELD